MDNIVRFTEADLVLSFSGGKSSLFAKLKNESDDHFNGVIFSINFSVSTHICSFCKNISSETPLI